MYFSKLLPDTLYCIIEQTACGVTLEGLDVAKAAPVMAHIIRELLEPAGLHSWSQQASAGQGFSHLCLKWMPLLGGVHVSISEICSQMALSPDKVTKKRKWQRKN